jgi:methylmalonyl-CoA/ethylmalonyl-CoA epimerase
MSQSPVKILGVDHIGLAPSDASALRRLFADLGLQDEGSEVVATQQTKTYFYAPSQKQSVTTRLEILEPFPAGEGPVAKFLEKKKSGIHHIALSVEGIEEIVRRLKMAKYQFVTDAVQTGAHQTKVIFLHPQSTGGILVELVETSL